MKVRDVFESGIMQEGDDFVITEGCDMLVDNRERIDDSLKDYFDRDVDRIYSWQGVTKIRIYARGWNE